MPKFLFVGCSYLLDSILIHASHFVKCFVIQGSNKAIIESEYIPFYLPILPPSTNAMYGRKRNGQVYEKKEAKDFKKNAVLFLPKGKTISQECALTVDFNFSERRGYLMRDLDNLLKVFIDALQLAKLVSNDRLITKITAKKTLSSSESVKGELSVIHPVAS